MDLVKISKQFILKCLKTLLCVIIFISSVNWIIIHVLHYLGVILSLSILTYLMIYIQPFSLIGNEKFNTIERNNNFNFHSYHKDKYGIESYIILIFPIKLIQSFLCLRYLIKLFKLYSFSGHKIFDLILFNLTLISLFWAQHSTMARGSFKKYMASITDNAYYYQTVYDRVLFVLFSAIMLFLVLYFYQPIHSVIYDFGTSNICLYISFTSKFIQFIIENVFALIRLAFQAFGFYMFAQTMWDLLYSDVFGFDHFRHFKKEGTKFPMPFNMKGMSRAAFSCRHPLMTAFLFFFIGSSIYGPLTLGRVVFVIGFMSGIMLGISHEERDLRRHAGKEFEGFCRMIPNLIIPDFTVIFMGPDKFNQLNKQFNDMMNKAKQ